ncbi:MAG: cupin [Oxalobacteraceae bacterium]|nr:MAG: cupin [Oxalobacteraceae bacterium]
MTTSDTLLISAAPPFPNSRLPLLLYRASLPADADRIQQAFEKRGWSNAWQNGIYRFHHFHSIAHEVLGIASGRVTVRFGGPAGTDVSLVSGDAVVIPAGVAHCNLKEQGRLTVVGAYPGGSSFDTLRGNMSHYVTASNRAVAVPVPDEDPIPGFDALRRLWRATHP